MHLLSNLSSLNYLGKEKQPNGCNLIIGSESIQKQEELLNDISWPNYLREDKYISKYWSNIYQDLLKYQFMITSEDNEIVGVGNACAVYWEGNFDELPQGGFDWALEQADKDLKNDIEPNLLIGLQIMLNPNFKSKGFSYILVNVMKDIARHYNFKGVALPIRPMYKSKFPEVSMLEYMEWENEKGEAFDPWIRVHENLGAYVSHPCEKAMIIQSDLSQWEKWIGETFESNGDYIIPGALSKLSVDIDLNLATYVEPNLWMIHEIND